MNRRLYTSETELRKGDASHAYMPLATGGEVRIVHKIGSLVTRDFRVETANARARYREDVAAGFKKENR